MRETGGESPVPPLRKTPPPIYDEIISCGKGHNSWEQVRCNKSVKTLRCRTCQYQAKCREPLRCPAFDSDQSCSDQNCKKLHIFARKWGLHTRMGMHGAVIAEKLPERLTNQDSEVWQVARGYEVTDLIKSTPTHVLLHATRKRDSQYVSMKIRRCRDQLQAQLRLLELRRLQNLDHPHLAPCVDTFVSLSDLKECRHHTVMPLYSGTLEDVLGKKEAMAGLQKRTVVQLARSIASALSFMHGKGHIHRDVHPENIMIRREGDGMDFVLSLVEDIHDSPTLYTAPEQHLLYTAKADMWGLGLTICRALLRKEQWHSKAKLMKEQHNRGFEAFGDILQEKMEASMAAVLLQLIHKDATRRPDAEGFLENIRAVAGTGTSSNMCFVEMSKDGILVDLNHNWYHCVQYKLHRDNYNNPTEVLEEAARNDPRIVGFYYLQERSEGGFMYDYELVKDEAWPLPVPEPLTGTTPTWYSKCRNWKGTGPPSDKTTTEVGKGWEAWKAFKKVPEAEAILGLYQNFYSVSDLPAEQEEGDISNVQLHGLVDSVLNSGVKKEET